MIGAFKGVECLRQEYVLITKMGSLGRDMYHWQRYSLVEIIRSTEKEPRERYKFARVNARQG